MAMRPGVLLNGRYRLDDRVATGGVGEVWKATDQATDRSVAVKVLRDRHAGDPWFRERFRAEARHTSVLTHPGIARVLDYVEEGSLAYLVMEYVAGRPLSSLLRGGRQLGTRLTLGIVGQVAATLQAAHNAGVIHRDIKPANLIVGYDGAVKVTDFGIARAADMATLTQPGVVVGTAVYMSPEQAEAQRVTAATDVYSLGVVCYECLAGRVPFLGSTPVEIAFGHVRDQPPPLPAYVPALLRDLVDRCLAKDPDQRPASMSEIAEAAYVIAETLSPARPVLAGAGPARSAVSAAAVGLRRGAHRGRHRGAPRWRPRHGAAQQRPPGAPRWRHRAGAGIGSLLTSPHPMQRRRAVVASLAGTTVLASGLLLGVYATSFPGKAPFRGAETSVSPTPSPSPTRVPGLGGTPSLPPGTPVSPSARPESVSGQDVARPNVDEDGSGSSRPDLITPPTTQAQPGDPPSRDATGWPTPDVPSPEPQPTPSSTADAVPTPTSSPSASR